MLSLAGARRRLFPVGKIYCLIYTCLLIMYTIDAPLSLDPSCTVLHYAQTLFEGMKAYRDEHGKVTLFRPDMNMKVRLVLRRILCYPVLISSVHRSE